MSAKRVGILDLKSLPFNIARYAQASDKLLAEFLDAYYLDRQAAVAGFTLLRPTDAELKKLVEEMKKVKGHPPDPKFLLQQKAGLAYILKGAIIDTLHASNFYVSLAERAYAIYLDKDTLYIHNDKVDGKKQLEGTPAKLVTFTQNGAAIYALKGALPKGSDPIQRPPRTPLGAPVQMVPMSAMLGGGLGSEVRLCPCELTGGQLAHGSRQSMLEWLKKEYPSDWLDVANYSLIGYIDKVCSEETCPPDMKKSVLAVLTGNPRMDFFTLFAPYAENPLKNEIRRTSLNLIPDAILDNWFHTLEEQPDFMRRLSSDYKMKVGKILADGVTPEATKARAAFISAMRGKVASAKVSTKAEAAKVLEPILSEIKAVYSTIASSNSVEYAGQKVKVFDSDVHKYLRSRFGGELQNYFAWRDYLFLAVEKLESESEWLDILLMMVGKSYAEDTKQMFSVSTKFGQSMLVKGITGGFFPYIRASLDALDANMAEVRGGYLIVGGGLGEIDTKYRGSFDYESDDELVASKVPEVKAPAPLLDATPVSLPAPPPAPAPAPPTATTIPLEEKKTAAFRPRQSLIDMLG